MLKYQKILKAFLLITVVSGTALEVVASGVDAVSYEPVVDAERLAHFTRDSRVRGSYYKHQAASVEIQDRIHEAKQYWFGANSDVLPYRLAEAKKKFGKIERQRVLANSYVGKDGEKASKLAEFKAEKSSLDESLKMLEHPDDIAATRRRLDVLVESIEALQQNFAVFTNAVRKANEEVERLTREQSSEAQSQRDKFVHMIYNKFRTVYNLCDVPLETNSAGFLDRLAERYRGLPLEVWERGTIISPLDYMAPLLHAMGIGPELIVGLDSAKPGKFHPQAFIYKLMIALEVPDPRFTSRDLPTAYYKKTPAGNYELNPLEPRGFLESYGAMLDYLGYTF
ncbi:MAG: hypothetical protein K2W94_03650 [Alphaproteobacteria bacterium]|nr:hypothetical protein [Alphaproteobacteria bacterium]